MKEKIFETRCGNIHYWTNSIKHEKRNLVFLPGLTADHRLFGLQVRYFKDKCNVLAWDAPAHGESRPFSFGFDLKDKATWLKDILEKEEMEDPILVGQSMGGYVAQMFMELFPGEASAFVSIDSAPLGRAYVTSAEIWLLKRMEPVYYYYPWSMLLDAGTKGVAQSNYGRRLMKAMMQTYACDKEHYAKLCGHGYKMLADAMEADLPYEIDCPAVLICGDKDQAGSVKRYNKAWAAQTGISLEWISGAGHNSNTDAPERVNQIIEELMESL